MTPQLYATTVTTAELRRAIEQYAEATAEVALDDHIDGTIHPETAKLLRVAKAEMLDLLDLVFGEAA